jgi:hypothetical protein
MFNYVPIKHKQMSFVSNGGKFKVYTVLLVNGLIFPTPTQSRISFEQNDALKMVEASGKTGKLIKYLFLGGLPNILKLGFYEVFHDAIKKVKRVSVVVITISKKVEFTNGELKQSLKERKIIKSVIS